MCKTKILSLTNPNNATRGGGGGLSGKVGTGRCSLDRVPFQPPRLTNDYLKIGLDIGCILAKYLNFDDLFLLKKYL